MIKCVNSKNKKLGGIYATYRKVGQTCPSTCSWLNNGCYAQYGFVNIHSKKSEYDEEDAKEVFEFVSGLPEKSKIRHHVSGDFFQPGDIPDFLYINSVVMAHEHRDDIQGWSYTHGWQMLDAELMNAPKSLCVNASCDDSDEMFEAIDQGWPATVVVGEDSTGGIISKDGKEARIVICPNQTHDITCKECMLCFRKQRSCVVGFRAHGSGKTKLLGHLGDNPHD